MFCGLCSGSDQSVAVLLAAFPSIHVPVVAATACLVAVLLDPAAALDRHSPWHMKLHCLDLVAALLLGVLSWCAPASPRPRLRWHALACLPGPLPAHGCSAYGPVLLLPQCPCLRLLLSCTCPPLCAGVLWPMPAWVWRYVRSAPLFGLSFVYETIMLHKASVNRCRGRLSESYGPRFHWGFRGHPDAEEDHRKTSCGVKPAAA